MTQNYDSAAKCFGLAMLCIVLIMLAGCQTSKTREQRATISQTQIDSCYEQQRELAATNAAVYQRISDEDTVALLYVVDQLAARNRAADCHNLAIAEMNADTQMRMAGINLASTAVTWTIGGLALASAFDSFADLGESRGNYTISNSRAIVDSGNHSSGGSFSSSGEGLGTGNVNVFDNSQGQGGIQPRQAQVQDSNSIETPSQSGENDAPGVGDELLPIEMMGP